MIRHKRFRIQHPLRLPKSAVIRVESSRFDSVCLTHVRQENPQSRRGRIGVSSLDAGDPTADPFQFTVVGSTILVTLERPAFIGRGPALPRVPSGVRPRLVRVPSATGEISGSHIELRQVGVTVVATDLKSTNGSVVRMPGRPPVTLRQGESLVVAPFTLIDIGDGIVLEILPREHRARSSGTTMDS